MPTQQALADLAPEKDQRTIKLSMARIRSRREESVAEQKAWGQQSRRSDKGKPAAFAPAGQSTQIIVGAEPSTDAQILQTSSELYAGYALRRVYYSAFSPIPDASMRLPVQQPPLLREHRLYQADWMMRFYGYAADEITQSTEPGTAPGMLSLDVDPKLGWALANRGFFPVDLNLDSRARLLRVPGLGIKSVNGILQMRKFRKVRLEDLVAMRAGVKKAMPFVVCTNHHPSPTVLDSVKLRARYTPPAQQLSLL